MENAVQALKTAAAVLIFIIAIATSFTMFSRTKVTTDAILKVQDQQAYLDAPNVNGGILYTSSEDIASGNMAATMTREGNRIVRIDDVVSTLYRYWIEKYSVTLVKNGEIIARFDSSLEAVLQSLPGGNTIIDNSTGNPVEDSNGNEITVDMMLDGYAEGITDAIKRTVTKEDLKRIYKIESDSNKKIGAPWLGDDTEVIKRINAELDGKDYMGQDGQKYKVNYNLRQELETSQQITEFFYRTDNSKYLIDQEEKTNLLVDNQLPTIEIVYIIE